MRDRDDDYGDNESAAEFYKRKQSVKRNRIGGEGVIAPPDRDAEDSHYSYGQKGYERPAAGKGVKSSTIWDDEAWRDKE